MTQYAFFFNQKRCLGCKTCVIACKEWNDRVVTPVDELHADPLPFQLGRQVGDPVAFGQDAGYGVEHLLPHFIRSVQPFGLYVLPTVGECQPVSAFKLFADFDVPAAFVLIRHKRPAYFTRL